MPNDALTWGDASQSQYLTKDDLLKDGQVVTIDHFEKRDIESRDGNVQHKMVMFVKELEKPLVLNKTNAQTIKAITGTDVPADAIGEKIEIYVDPSVSFGGQIIGGIRVRHAAEIPA